jgi:N4-bis(aminopropyl)spermidine synthase
MSIDLRLAMNALSDVIENRPLPLREFDQIYMKVGDLFVHSEMLSRRLEGKRVVFVGDGDAVGITLTHLYRSQVLEAGPEFVTVLDFDERMVNSVKRFADDYGYSDYLSAELYNVSDPLPTSVVGEYDAFHINPPWGQYNNGESVLAFLERGFCSLKAGGVGIIVIGHNHDGRWPWADKVMQRVQAGTVQLGGVVDEMLPNFHSYHLDDAPELRSCALMIRRLDAGGSPTNHQLTAIRRTNFYGRDRNLKAKYIRDLGAIARDRAPTSTYQIEWLTEEEQ